MNRWYLQEEVLRPQGQAVRHALLAGRRRLLLQQDPVHRSTASSCPDNDTWTWNDLLDAAQKLTKPGETWGIQMGYGFEFSWINFLRSAGEDWINKEKTKTTLNTAGAVEAFQWLVDLVQQAQGAWPRPATPPAWARATGGTRARSASAWPATAPSAAPSTRQAGLRVGPVRHAQAPQDRQAGDHRQRESHGGHQGAPRTRRRPTSWPPSTRTASRRAWSARSASTCPRSSSRRPTPPAGSSTPPAMHEGHAGVDEARRVARLPPQLAAVEHRDRSSQLLPAFRGEMGVKEACDKASQIGDSLLRGI